MLFKGYYWDKMLLGFSALVVEKNKGKKKRCFWALELFSMI